MERAINTNYLQPTLPTQVKKKHILTTGKTWEGWNVIDG